MESTSWCQRGGAAGKTQRGIYLRNFVQRVPLRVKETDFLSDDICGDETPVNLQMDGHQQETLGEQINLQIWQKDAQGQSILNRCSKYPFFL